MRPGPVETVTTGQVRHLTGLGRAADGLVRRSCVRMLTLCSHNMDTMEVSASFFRIFLQGVSFGPGGFACAT